MGFKVKKQLQSLGLSHLFTPSGLHLSSVLILFRSMRKLRMLCCILLLLTILPMGSYHSMERVLIFTLVNFKVRSISKSFILTFLISYLMAHYQNNPLSFSFSLLFWGTILIFRHNPVKVLCFLQVSFLLTSITLRQEVHFLFVLINPVTSFIFSSLFPFFFFNSLLPSSLQFNLHFFFEEFLLLITNLNEDFLFLSHIPSFIAPLVMLSLLYRNKVAVFALLLCPINLKEPRQNQDIPHKIINLPSKEEMIKIKKSRVYFLDRSCDFKVGDFRCKFNDSQYGGFKL